MRRLVLLMTTLSQTIQDKYSGQQFYTPEKNPDKLPNRRRILFEIEQALQISDEDLKLETVRKKGSRKGRTKIPNRDLYRIYKAILNMRKVRPSIVYTGGSIMDMSEAEELVRETDKSLTDLEPSL